MGSSTYDPAENLTAFSTTAKPSKASKKKGSSGGLALRDLERELEVKLNEKRTSFDPAYFSNEGRIHRRGIPPVISKASIEKLTEPQKYHFQYGGSETASSNDMAFSYGLVKITSVKDGKEVVTSACYMRVWKNVDGKWNIVLDVIGG